MLILKKDSLWAKYQLINGCKILIKIILNYLQNKKNNILNLNLLMEKVQDMVEMELTQVKLNKILN